MIRLAVFIFVLISADGVCQNSIPTKNLSDEVLSVLTRYERDLIKENSDDTLNRNYLLRIETKTTDEVIVYVGSVDMVGEFEQGIPNAFARVNNRIAFIFELDSQVQSNKQDFGTFYDQFSSVLNRDVTREGKFNESFHYEYLYHRPLWRAILHNGRIKRIDLIPLFPWDKVLQKYYYDSNGSLRFLDGPYYEGSVTPHRWYADDFDLRNYVLENTSIPSGLLDSGQVIATMVIDESGRVTEVTIDGLDDPKLIAELELALKKMPPWQPGRIQKKAVKVRIRHLI